MAVPFYILAVGVPFMFGLPLHSTVVPPLQPAAKAAVISVNFIDRLLQNRTTHRTKSSFHRRKRSAANGQADTSADELPINVPIPAPKPTGKAAAAEPPLPASTTQPQPKIVGNVPTPDQNIKSEGNDVAPGDFKKPNIDQNEDRDTVPVGQGKPSNDAESPPEILHENPEELKKCLAEMDALGAKFARIDPIDEGNGCGIENPVKIDEVLPGLSLGGAIMRCKTATSLARWLKNTVQPALDIARPGRTVVAIIPGTTFACRLRNNASSGVISEHARGNAFDVAAFRLDNGETVEMKPRQDDHSIDGAFQKAATAGACLYFTTVLAPGSDVSHETHMHVDIKDRKNGYRICESP